MKSGNIGRSMRGIITIGLVFGFFQCFGCASNEDNSLVTNAGGDAENLGAEPSDAAVLPDVLSHDMETVEMVDSAVGDAGEDQDAMLNLRIDSTVDDPDQDVEIPSHDMLVSDADGGLSIDDGGIQSGDSGDVGRDSQLPDSDGGSDEADGGSDDADGGTNVECPSAVDFLADEVWSQVFASDCATCHLEGGYVDTSFEYVSFILKDPVASMTRGRHSCWKRLRVVCTTVVVCDSPTIQPSIRWSKDFSRHTNRSSQKPAQAMIIPMLVSLTAVQTWMLVSLILVSKTMLNWLRTKALGPMWTWQLTVGD